MKKHLNDGGRRRSKKEEEDMKIGRGAYPEMFLLSSSSSQ